MGIKIALRENGKEARWMVRVPTFTNLEIGTKASGKKIVWMALAYSSLQMGINLMERVPSRGVWANLLGTATKAAGRIHSVMVVVSTHSPMETSGRVCTVMTSV